MTTGFDFFGGICPILWRTERGLSAFLIDTVVSSCSDYLEYRNQQWRRDLIFFLGEGGGICPILWRTKRTLSAFLIDSVSQPIVRRSHWILEDVRFFLSRWKHRKLSWSIESAFERRSHRPWRLSHFETDSIPSFASTRSAVLARITNQNQKKTTALIVGDLLRKALFFAPSIHTATGGLHWGEKEFIC